jgi:hypothetical protein
MSFLLCIAFTSRAQNETAFNYFTINQTLSGKDVYIFTTPKAFQYSGGSVYAFAPVEYEKKAQRAIENKLKSIDPSFRGFYANQISNGSRTTSKNLQNARQQIADEMMEIYKNQKKLDYHNAVSILLVDIDTGSTLTEYALPATSLKTNTGSQGNAY